MTAVTLLAQAVAAVATFPAPPVDVGALPTLQLVRRAPMEPAASTYVRDEVRAGRCGIDPALRSLTVDVAVLVSDDGEVRRLMPRAIGCTNVEQYASGLVSRLIRRNVAAPATAGWYRTSISFAWDQ